MPNYVDNTLKIHCEDNKTMETIGELLFKRNEEDKLEYTMTKLLPRPEEFEGQPGYHKYGHKWSCIYWGTKWDVCSPETMIEENEITLYYQTAWSPNDKWVEALCRYINYITLDSRKENPSKIFVHHRFSEYAMMLDGYLYWEPGLAFEYKNFGGDDYCEKFQSHLKKIETNRLREEEAMLFLAEDYLPQDPEEVGLIFPEDLVDEMSSEFLNRFIDEKDELTIKLINIKVATFREICKDFYPEEIMAIYEFREEITEDISVKYLRNSLIAEILDFDLNQFEIRSNELLIAKLCQVPDQNFYLFIQTIFKSQIIWICSEQYFESLEQSGYYS